MFGKKEFVISGLMNNWRKLQIVRVQQVLLRFLQASRETHLECSNEMYNFHMGPKKMARIEL